MIHPLHYGTSQNTAEITLDFTPLPLPHAPDDQLMLFREVMDYLKVSRSTLERFIRAGKIRAYHVGATRRFYKSDVDTLIVRQ